MGTWHDHLSEVKFRDFDSSNVTDSGHLIFFYISSAFWYKILVIREVLLREQDENTSPRTSRTVECGPLASVS